MSLYNDVLASAGIISSPPPTPHPPHLDDLSLPLLKWHGPGLAHLCLQEVVHPVRPLRVDVKLAVLEDLPRPEERAGERGFAWGALF